MIWQNSYDFLIEKIRSNQYKFVSPNNVFCLFICLRVRQCVCIFTHFNWSFQMSFLKFYAIIISNVVLVRSHWICASCPNYITWFTLPDCAIRTRFVNGDMLATPRTPVCATKRRFINARRGSTKWRASYIISIN